MTDTQQRADGRLGLPPLNFALLSAAVVTCAVAGISVFAFFYLAVFDSSLIWLIDYSDITKFLIALATLFLSTIILMAIIPYFRARRLETRLPQVTLIITISSICVGTAVLFWDYFIWHRPESMESHITIFIAAAAALLCLVILARIYRAFSAWEDLEEWAILAATALYFIFLASLGHFTGLGVKNSAMRHSHQVTIKTSKGEDATFANCAIVLITSHHMVFHTGDETLTLPSSDVIRIVFKERK